MDWLMQQQMGEMARQQRAYRQRLQAQRQQEQARIESLNATYGEKPAPPPSSTWWAPEGGQELGPMPEAVRNQLEESGGLFGLWLPTQHEAWRLDAWREEWKHTSPRGRQLLEVERQRAEQAAANAANAERDRLRLADEQRLRRERQEAHRLAVGTVVRVTARRQSLHDRIGRLVAVRWGEELLMGGVMVDPLPPDHPMYSRPPRMRPVAFMPQLHWLPMEQLRREHPEALA